MNLTKTQILIKGGSSGIGYGLAEQFIQHGSRVMITGRNSAALDIARKRLKGLEIFVSDIGDARQRETLAEYVKEKMPGLTMLINNAGIQRRIALATDDAPWFERQTEIDVVLEGPVHLNHLLIPTLLAQNKPSYIINVTSGGAYIPQPFAPLYSACKAVLHHYTLVLRHALNKTSCRVIELILPAVQTALAGLAKPHGVETTVFCQAAFEQIVGGQENIGFGQTKDLELELSGQPQSFLFARSSAHSNTTTYRSVSSEEKQSDALSTVGE